jgi:hypothetical protein
LRSPAHSPWLDLRNVSISSAGEYMCVANNGIPPPVGKTFRVDIMRKEMKHFNE